jgi:hypothetical protein
MKWVTGEFTIAGMLTLVKVFHLDAPNASDAS